MAAILDSGFEEPVPTQMYGSGPSYPARVQRGGSALRDDGPVRYGQAKGHGYYPEEQYAPIDSHAGMPNSGDSVSSAVDSRQGAPGHAKKRSGGAGVDRYGPLGPLADDDTGWGSRQGYQRF